MLDLRGLRELSVAPRAVPDFVLLALTLVFTHSALILTAVSAVLTLV
jgi:hypothetical protein